MSLSRPYRCCVPGNCLLGLYGKCCGNSREGEREGIRTNVRRKDKLDPRADIQILLQ